MYNLNEQDINMSSIQKFIFEESLKRFYDNALYDEKEYKIFFKELSLDVINNKNKLNDLIFKFTKFDEININNDDISLMAKIMTIIVQEQPDLLNKLKQGGKNNFVYYIELEIAKRLSKDTSFITFLKEEQFNVMKSVREMQFFRYNPPDQMR